MDAARRKSHRRIRTRSPASTMDNTATKDRLTMLSTSLSQSATPLEAPKWVCYYRVSTHRQGESGLGLEAQHEAVKRYIAARGGIVIAEFTEAESGKKASNRPQLLQALDRCRKQKATLAIAKLDRLARNVHFIS